MRPGGSMPHSQGQSNIPRVKSHGHFSLPWSFQIISRVPRPCVMFLIKDGSYSVKLLASRQSPKLEDHSCSAVHDCLSHIFTANLHICRLTPPSAIRGDVPYRGHRNPRMV